MSLTDFFHGVETVTVDTGARPIQTVRSSVLFLNGTAPKATDAFRTNVPTLVTGRNGMAGLGAEGSLPAALDAIFDQAGAIVCVNKVEQGSDDRLTMASVIGGVNDASGALTGMFAARSCETLLGVAPMLFGAPGFTHQRPAGVDSVTVTAMGSGYTQAIVKFHDGGAIVQAEGVPVIVNGKIAAIQITKPGWGHTDVPSIEIVGDGTGAAATATVGASANPLIGETLSLADDMKAHIIADGPSTTDSDALAARADWGSRRVFMVDPHVSGYRQTTAQYEEQPPSARVMGLIARVDNDLGFWESPSNKEVYGIGGLARPIDFNNGAKNSRVQILNSNEIATFIRDDGWYLYGNRTCSTDPKYAFLSVSRTADIIDISINKAHRWAVDRAIKRNYFDDVSGSVSAYMRSLAKRGAMLGGSCWYDPELNTPDEISSGHATFDYDFTPPFPAERVTFRSHLVNDYIPTIFS